MQLRSGVDCTNKGCSLDITCDPRLPQDKAAVLTDVRTIIAEQLGTDLDKVWMCWVVMWCVARSCVIAQFLIAGNKQLVAQVAPDSKFVDLGADSLDTVRA